MPRLCFAISLFALSFLIPLTGWAEGPLDSLAGDWVNNTDFLHVTSAGEIDSKLLGKGSMKQTIEQGANVVISFGTNKSCFYFLFFLKGNDTFYLKLLSPLGVAGMKCPSGKYSRLEQKTATDAAATTPPNSLVGRWANGSDGFEIGKEFHVSHSTLGEGRVVPTIQDGANVEFAFDRAQCVYDLRLSKNASEMTMRSIGSPSSCPSGSFVRVAEVGVSLDKLLGNWSAEDGSNYIFQRDVTGAVTVWGPSGSGRMERAATGSLAYATPDMTCTLIVSVSLDGNRLFLRPLGGPAKCPKGELNRAEK